MLVRARLASEAAYYLPQVAQQLLHTQHVALLLSLIALQQALRTQLKLLSALPCPPPPSAVTGLILGIEVFCFPRSR